MIYIVVVFTLTRKWILSSYQSTIAPVSQSSPVYPLGQWHVRVSSVSRQVPPCWQGVILHKVSEIEETIHLYKGLLANNDTCSLEHTPAHTHTHTHILRHTNMHTHTQTHTWCLQKHDSRRLSDSLVREKINNLNTHHRYEHLHFSYKPLHVFYLDNTM